MHSSSNSSEGAKHYFSSSSISKSQKNYAILDYLCYMLSLVFFSSHFVMSFALSAISSYSHSKYIKMDNHLFNYAFAVISFI